MYVGKIYHAPYVVLAVSFAQRGSALYGLAIWKKYVFNCFLKLLLLTVVGLIWTKMYRKTVPDCKGCKTKRTFCSLSPSSRNIKELLFWWSQRSHRNLIVKKWYEVRRFAGLTDAESHHRDLDLYPILNRQPVKWAQHRPNVFIFSCSGDDTNNWICTICNLWKFASDVPTRRELQ